MNSTPQLSPHVSALHFLPNILQLSPALEPDLFIIKALNFAVPAPGSTDCNTSVISERKSTSIPLPAHAPRVYKPYVEDIDASMTYTYTHAGGWDSMMENEKKKKT